MQASIQLLSGTLLFGNRYGLFGNNPVTSRVKFTRYDPNSTTIAARAAPYRGDTAPPPLSDTPP